MARLTSALPPTTRAVAGVLRSKGFELGDFELEEQGESGLGRLFGVVGGLLRVRCWSTGEERMYSTGSGSAWLGAFLGDLSGGLFERAARERRQPLVLAA